MEDRKLTEKESLELISRMIRETRENIEKRVAYPFLIWGYLTVIVSISVWYVLWKTGNYHWYGLWLVLPVIGWPISWIAGRKEKVRVATYMDRMIYAIWTVIGISVIAVGCVSFRLEENVLFLIALLMSIGTTLSGWVIRFKPLAWAGVLSIVLSFILLFVPGINQILIFAVLFVIMMIIPGHIFYNHVTKCSKI